MIKVRNLGMKKEKEIVKLSDHFTYGRLLRFTYPSIVMLVFTSIYGVVDGFFVSNFTGKTPFAAVNFIYPFLMMLGCIGFMFGTGGAALISLTMGVGRRERANELFSLIVYVSAACGVVLAVFGFLFLRPIASLMGAEGAFLENSLVYGRIILLAIPFFILQYEFQCLFAAAEKPKLGLYVTIAAGVTNIVLDALFVAVFQWGLEGAAAATALSQFVGGTIPLIYFGRKNSSLLRLTKCTMDVRALLKVCANGSSELASNISMSLVNMLYNVQLMKYVGEEGVAAYGVLMYVCLIFQAVFLGYSVGSAPITGYHYGAGNYGELRGLLHKSINLIGIFSVMMFAAGEILAAPLSKLFVGYDDGMLQITVRAFYIFSVSFLLSGFSIFGSSFFTALNDGMTSALISFMRTFLFQCLAIFVLPVFWGLDGIWVSTAAAEAMAVIVTGMFLFGKRKKYQYGKLTG